MKQALTQLNPRERIIFTACMTLVLVFLWTKVVFQPLREKEEGIDSKIQLSEGRIRKGLKSLAETGEAAGSRGQRYTIPGSPKKFLDKAVAEIKRNAATQDVQLLDVEPSDAVRDGMSTKLFINVRLRGKMSRTLEFVHQMEGAPHYLEPSEVFIQPDTDDNIQMNVTFRKIGLETPSK